MTYLGPGSPGLEITTASVTIDPALASADPGTMATAARTFASAAHQIEGARQASVQASAQLASDWSGKGKDGFDAASSKLNAGAKLGANAMAATSSALQTLSTEIAAAKAMAHKAQMMATDSAQAASQLQSAYAASSQQAVQALPPNATYEEALAARAPTAGQVAQANTISTDAAQATQLMAQANTMARQAWDKAAAAFQAVTATSPTRTARTHGTVHPKAKVSLDQVRVVTQADGQRVYSFDGGLKIPVDMPGAHHLVEDIKAYMPRFLAGDHGGLRVPADLSAKGLWFLAASFWVSTTMHDIPEELRNVFFTARFSSITMTELIGAGLTGLVVGGAYVEYQTGLFSNAIRTARATAGGSTSLNESARDPTPTSGNIPTTASQVTDQQIAQTNETLDPNTDVNIETANFAQKTYGRTFSDDGFFKGQTIDDIARKLETGELSVNDVPIDVVVRDGQTLILNTRSAAALEQAGIPRSSWYIENVTGNPRYESLLDGQLARNKLDNSGIANPRLSR